MQDRRSSSCIPVGRQTRRKIGSWSTHCRWRRLRCDESILVHTTTIYMNNKRVENGEAREAALALNRAKRKWPLFAYIADAPGVQYVCNKYWTTPLENLCSARDINYWKFKSVIKGQSASPDYAEQTAKKFNVPVDCLFPKHIYPWLYVSQNALRQALKKMQEEFELWNRIPKYHGTV